MTADQRRYPRRPGNNQNAVVFVRSNAPPILCTVADIFEGGAGLTFISFAGIHDTFKLEIKSEPEVHSCKVAWRKEPNQIGVAFYPETGA
jgi:hypothetical protein